MDIKNKITHITKLLLLVGLLLQHTVVSAANGKQLFVPINVGDITVFIPILPKLQNVTVSSSNEGTLGDTYQLDWDVVDSAAYYQITVIDENGNSVNYQTNNSSYLLAALPLGQSNVSVMACNAQDRCGVKTNLGTFSSSQRVQYYHVDVLGSPVLVTDQGGNVVKSFHYKPFGETQEDKSEEIGYAGHLEEPDLDLTYMRSRYYDPALGRFYATDPVAFNGEPKSFNRYAYANNNPYKYVDPDGQIPLAVFAVILLKEGGGEMFEQLTGIPAPTVKNIGKAAMKQLLKNRKIRSGVYQFKEDGKKYTGQAKDGLIRLKQHFEKEKLKQKDINSIKFKRMDGSTKTEREFVETKELRQATNGRPAKDAQDVVTNKRDPMTQQRANELNIDIELPEIDIGIPGI